MGKKKSLSLFYPSKGRAQETSSPVAGTTAWLAGGSYKQTAPNFHLCVKHNAVVFYNKLHPVGVSDMGSWKAAPRTGGWKNKLARQECIGCWTPLPHPGELSASKCLGNVRIKRWEQGHSRTRCQVNQIRSDFMICMSKIPQISQEARGLFCIHLLKSDKQYFCTFHLLQLKSAGSHQWSVMEILSRGSLF